MLRKRKNVFSILLAVLLVLPVLCSTVLAANHENPMFSIAVNMNDPDTGNVCDASIYLYKVAAAQVDESGNLHMEPIEPFKDLKFDSLSQQEVRSLVAELCKRITYPEHLSETSDVLTPIAVKRPEQDGMVHFEELDAGVYLARKWEQEKPANLEMSPVLVYLPNTDIQTGKWQYEVTASPKFNWHTDSAADSQLDESQIVVDSNTPESSPKLPQTGMVQWPIPILVLTGLFLLMIGYVILRSAKQN